jgi:hypothetical protein
LRKTDWSCGTGIITVASTDSEKAWGSDPEEYVLGILATQSPCPDCRERLLDMVEGLDFAEGFEDVLKVYSEIKEGISLRTPDSLVLVLWDEIVYKS